MATHNDFGKEAENKAAEFLKKKGYILLKRNWHFLKAEIDIIAKDEKANQIVIVEVKARKNMPLLNPEEAVTKSKRSLLVKAANEFIVTSEIELETRFDIISVNLTGENWKIEHIENAFLSFE